MMRMAKETTTVVDSISDANMMIRIAERLPSSYFFEVITGETDAGGNMAGKCFEEVRFHIERKIAAWWQQVLKREVTTTSSRSLN